ncbi:MAG: hypothetical protein JWM81_783 [Candidatus Saccharibacteria bacterium]|nr:hypothetical protein [Candidatus Saccharibacteria bacterium]
MSAHDDAQIAVYGAVDSRALLTNHRSQLTKTFCVLFFAVAGIIITSAISADSVRPYAAFEPESGRKTGPVIDIIDPAASGDAAVRFTAPAN